MKRVLNVILVAVAMLVILAFGVRAEDGKAEYIIKCDGGEYVLSIYVGIDESPVLRAENIGDIFGYLNELQEEKCVIFSDVYVSESFELYGAYKLYGTLKLTDSQMIQISGEITLCEIEIKLDNSSLRVKNGTLVLDGGKITSDCTAIRLDYLSTSGLFVHNGEIKSESSSAAIEIKHGSAYILGGEIANTSGTAIDSTSTLVLAGTPSIKGKDTDVSVSSPITLSYNEDYFSSKLNVNYKKSFEDGCISLVFYKSSPDSIKNIKLYDLDGVEMPIKHFSSYSGIDEKNFCAVYLPYTVSFYGSGELIDVQYLINGEKAENPSAPDRIGYEFDSWRVGESNGAIYDFEQNVLGSIDLYASYKLLPPSFSLSSLEFVYDGKEHSFGISEISHPLYDKSVISYSWFKDGEKLTDNGKQINLTSVSESGKYKCQIDFSCGTDSVSIVTPEVYVNIRKRTVTIPTINDKYYTAEYQSPDIYSTSVYTASISGGTEVGIYPVEITLIDTENYEFEGGTASAHLDFNIIKAENFWTEELSVFDIYEGNEPKPKAASRFGNAEFLYSDKKTGQFTSDIPAVPGVYYCIAKVDESENYYSLTSEPIEFSVINESVSGISIYSMPEVIEYKAFESFISTGLILSVSYNSSRMELVNADKIAFSYQTEDSFRYGDKAIIATYLGVSVAIPITVEKAEYDISYISFINSTVVYSGDDVSISYQGELPTGLDGLPLSATVTGIGKNVGEYEITLSFSTASKNYKVPESKTAILTVIPYETDVVFQNTEFVYDGNLKSPTAYYVDIYGRKKELDVSGAASLAGKYTASVYENDKNYKLNGTSCVFEISKADYDLSGIVWNEESFVYDGETKKVFATGLPDGVKIVGYSDNSAVSAGVYLAKAAVTFDSANYNPPEEISFAWEIKKADYDLTGFSFSDSVFVYDGQIHYPSFSGQMPTGVDGATLKYEFSRGATHVIEGSVDVEIFFVSESDNYNIPSSIFAKVEIIPDEITVSWTNLEFVYDKLSHAPSAFAEECVIKVMGEMTDAGEYTATAISLNSDYRIINSTADFIITKAENFWIQKIEISNIFEGGAPKPNAKCLGGETEFRYYDKIDGEALDFIPTEAGTYYVEAFTAGNQNYKASYSEKKVFEIVKIVPVEMSASISESFAFAYDTVNPALITLKLKNNDGSVSLISGSDSQIKYQSADSLRFGDTYINVIYLDFSYRLTVNVKKANYDMSCVRWSESTFIYDGTEKTVSLTGLPKGVSVVEYTGNKACSAGEYEACAVLDYDEENFNAPTLPKGTFVIHKAVIASPEIPALIYSGTEQLPAVTVSEYYTADISVGTDVGEYPIVFRLADGENYSFADGTNELTVYYKIEPMEITIRISDIDKYKFSEMPEPLYEIVYGDIVFGDELGIDFVYHEDEVSAICGNKNYSATVINGKIIRHTTLSEDDAFKLFLVILILITLTLILLAAFYRREDVLHCVSVIKCRIMLSYRNKKRLRQSDLKDEDKASDAADTEKTENSESTLSVDAERADSLISDSLARNLVHRENDIIETSGRKKGIINVDTLSENFNAGERVDVNKLKEMSLIPYDTAYIKVLARGMIDKPLKVYANDFSLAAVKMIALTGGEAVRVITLRKKEAKGDASEKSDGNT